MNPECQSGERMSIHDIIFVCAQSGLPRGPAGDGLRTENDLAKATTNRGRGQPATGPNGERVRDYPALLVRIPRATLRRLQALSLMRRTPQWAIVDEAIRSFIERLPVDEREQIERSRGRRGLRQFKARD
jgi:hypothetical protein